VQTYVIHNLRSENRMAPETLGASRTESTPSNVSATAPEDRMSGVAASRINGFFHSPFIGAASLFGIYDDCRLQAVFIYLYPNPTCNLNPAGTTTGFALLLALGSDPPCEVCYTKTVYGRTIRLRSTFSLP